MKRWIHASADVQDPADVAIAAFGSTHPQVGCTFIATDGTFVNIYPKVDVHEDLCEWVQDNSSAECAYSDEEFFVREYGWIRLRIDPQYFLIELPPNKLTNSQLYSLEDWFLLVEERYPNASRLSVEVCSESYNSRSTTSMDYISDEGVNADELIRKIRRYNGSGKLYASSKLN